MTKSVVVAVQRMWQHPRYPKLVRRTSKFMAHDETNACNIGDEVGSRASLALNRVFADQCKSRSTRELADSFFDYRFLRSLRCSACRVFADQWKIRSTRELANSFSDYPFWDVFVVVQVRLESSRPLSKRKHWIVQDIIRRARIFQAPDLSKITVAKLAQSEAQAPTSSSSPTTTPSTPAN